MLSWDQFSFSVCFGRKEIAFWFLLPKHSSWCLPMFSEKVSKSSECLWPSGPKFLWDPEVTLEKDSDMRLRSDMIGGWWWMLLKEMQF